MIVQELQTPGCLRLVPKVIQDERGNFVKPYVAAAYQRLGLPLQFAEEYYSTSARNVLRGMHFQAPPFEYAKLVSCLAGTVMDVIVDIRKGSPRYGRPEVMKLTADEPGVLYLPPGIAHGFLVLTDSAMLSYKVTSPHAPECDLGIRWDAIGLDWGIQHPVISARDAAFPALADLDSPFTYFSIAASA